MSFVLHKVKAGYKFSYKGLSINHVLLIDDLKLFGKSGKQLDNILNTAHIFSKEKRMEFVGHE